MRLHTLTDASLGAFLTVIESEPGGSRHLFRGQADSEWNLVPSLYRFKNVNIGAESKEKAYDCFETMFLERFFREGLPYLPSLERGYSNDRILAQHFGVPTRLLDWSHDPFVALFFAVQDWQQNCDAALFMILPDAHYRPEDVCSLGPHKIISIAPPAIDRRVPAQKSVFTFHPYGDPHGLFVPLDKRDEMGNQITDNKNQLTRGFAKIVIPRGLKRHLFHNLLQAGIDRRNLFPGLDGVGLDIAARMQIGMLS